MLANLPIQYSCVQTGPSPNFNWLLPEDSWVPVEPFNWSPTSHSIGHSSQLSLLPYQTWRSYYEMTLIVVSNLPHLFTSGRWHWGSRGRRKERIGRKFVPKAAWQDNNRQNWRLVALTGRGVGGYTITTLGIRSQELYRDETNSPTK